MVIFASFKNHVHTPLSGVGASWQWVRRRLSSYKFQNKGTSNKEEDEEAQISFKLLPKRPPPCFFPSLKTPSLWIGSEITERKKKAGNFQLAYSDAYVSSAHFSTKFERAFRHQEQGSMAERTSIVTYSTFHVSCPYNATRAEVTGTSGN